MPTEQEVLKALSRIQDPDLHRDIVSLGFIRNLKISNGTVSFDIMLTTPACPVKDQIHNDAKRFVAELPGVKNVEAKMSADVRRTVDLDKAAIKDVKNIIAVASGKGGVGKSTVAANLAAAMAQTGARVGLLDADIYGPTIPLMMGSDAQISGGENDEIIPALAHGVKFMSMGFMAPGDKPLIWRGPKAHYALQQSLFQTRWGELDYLFVDLPPGTGDVHLTLVQSTSVTGAVIVSTPQDVGLTISLKTYRMFETTNVKTLGLIENMSHFVCSHCGQRDDIFGHGGAKEAAQKLGIPFLGEVPLDKRIREQADKGVPIVVAYPDSPIGQVYKSIVKNLAAQISIASYETPRLMITPKEIRRKTDGTAMQITWSDGHTGEYPAPYLRDNCKCAACRNEHTGERMFPPGKIPADITVLKSEVMGNYALGFIFSDGHSSGIYSFEYLREICPDCERKS